MLNRTPELESMSIQEIGRTLKKDDKNNLYWNDKPIKTKLPFSLLALLTIISTIVAIVVGSLSSAYIYTKLKNEFAQSSTEEPEPQNIPNQGG